jgi:hypothetical protein
MNTPHWTKTATGYALGEARLERRGRRWALVVGDAETDLGPRATFDDAEKALAS